MPPRLRRTRLAVSVTFFVNGGVFASWALHIPYVQERLGLGEGVLGLALLSIGVGGLVMMPLTGALIARFGSRRVVEATAFVYCLLLPVIVTAPGLGALVIGLFGFGATGGAMDIAMNAQAVGVERRHERPILSSVHAMWSLGGLAGAGLGGLALWLGVSPRLHALVVAGLTLLIALAAARALLPATVDVRDDAPLIALPRGSLFGLGVMGFFAFLAEGSIADWSAVYLRHELGTSAGMAGSGYAAHSLAMVAGRLLGDRLRGRFGPVVLVRASASLAAVGLGTALLIGHPVAAIVGFTAVGLGFANIVPVIFGAAGNQPGVASGTGLSAVATAAYLGLLAGPPLIGFVAEATTLPIGLGVVATVAALIAVQAGRLRTPSAAES